MNRIDARMHDGRELFYFDDADSPRSSDRKPDTRTSDVRPETATMRLDPLTGDWVSIATARNNRAFLPPASACPLCPSTTEFASEIPDEFDVVVFENKGPAFGPALASPTDNAGEADASAAQPFGTTATSVGRCEVVVFAPEHTGSLGNMPVTRIRTVIDAWSNRTAELREMPGVVEVMPFENRGQEVGVTLHHPHGQIYAYPYITPTTKKLLASIAAHNGDFFADLLAFEQASDRVLIASDNFTAYVPFAARWPIEIHLLPHRRVGTLSELTEAERDELAQVYSQLLRSIDALYDSPTGYISAWHQAPRLAVGADVRLQLQITSPRRAADKLKFLAGSESAMGAFIGDVSPETQAQALREALARIDS